MRLLKRFKPEPNGNFIEIDKQNYSESRGWYNDGRIVMHVGFFQSDDANLSMDKIVHNLADLNPVRGKEIKLVPQWVFDTLTYIRMTTVQWKFSLMRLRYKK